MGENLMRVTQRYNKSSFSDKLLMLKENRTKTRVSLNSMRWPGGGAGGALAGESQPLTLMWGKESQNQIKKRKKEKHFAQKSCSLVFFFFSSLDYKRRK